MLGCIATPLSVFSAPVLEEVLVTAEKRQQSLQDIPISIATMGADKLERFNIDELEDFSAKVPNVVINEYFGIATTFRSFIRGVGAVTVEVTQDPAVALYVDGIYVGSSFGGSFESADLERVEILRGPQGALYGRNATGGAINLISKKPQLDNFSFHQTLSGGNYNRLKSHTAVNIPLGDKAAIKLGYLMSERDGVVENTGLGEDYGVEDRTAARLALRVEPSDDLVIDFSAERNTIEDTTRYSQVLSGYAEPLAGTGVPISIPLAPFVTADILYPDPITGDRLDKGYSAFPVEADDNEILGSSLTLTWDMSENTTFKSITGYRDVDATQYTQVTGTTQVTINTPLGSLGPLTLGTGGVYEQEFTQVTQEFQLIGDVNFSGSSLQYVSGLYYYSDEGDNSDLSMSIGGLKLPGTDRTETENKSVAIYGQATYTPSGSNFHYTLGARYSDDQREAIRTNLNTTPAFQATKYDKDFSNFSPSLTVAYDLSDDVNIYAKAVSGYRSGGTSTLSYQASLFQEGADDETIVSYEIGMKGDFLDSRLRVNGAIFNMKYDDYQGSIQTGPQPAERDNLNIGDNTITGAELDLTVVVAEGMTFNLAMGYLDTEMGEDSVDPGTGAPLTPLIDTLPYAPELSYSATLDYQRPIMGDIELEWHINYSYQDESESGIIVGTSQLNDDYGLWDASIALTQIPFASGRAKVSLWGQNLTDEEYAVSNIGPFAPLGASEISPFGDPRTYGVTFTYEYD
ncbi:TonB-dependent receptor [Dasania marina]|uniref:TonB-dependent receptor n=1 Tax=Dasania marina TaxID=471499 RepID=UPI0003803256|nr:TonB-dependent receptor [Dasania marina]